VSRKTKPDARVCSVTDTIDLVGDRYALPIVRELGYGFRRFQDLARLTGAPRDVLTAKLRKLEAGGVLERRPYSDRPPRDEYVLTEAGRALLPIVLALKEWGDTYERGGAATVVFRHACGAEFHAEVVCAACGRPPNRELEVVGGTHPPELPGDRRAGR
jgi:DNA-binding HxlR family transcriptional regulator